MVEHLDISCPKVGKKHFIYINTVGVFNCAVYSYRLEAAGEAAALEHLRLIKAYFHINRLQFR